jgi:hypothetical protein
MPVKRLDVVDGVECREARERRGPSRRDTATARFIATTGDPVSASNSS